MTPAMRKACENGLARCNVHRLTVEFLEHLAETEPAWKERADELRSLLDHTEEVSKAGLFLMDKMQ